MKANPGGNIDPSEAYGRDELIASLWEILEQQSVVMTAERRIGKTTVIRKMQHQPPAGWFPIYQDLEKVHSAEEFAKVVFEQVQTFLGRWQKIANRAKKFFDEWQLEVAGTTVGRKQNRPWKTLLEHSVADLVDAKTDQRLLFLWDEMPYMIDNIRKREDETTAAEVLDTLRGLRQTQKSFRMVLTGSIGLHHVLQRLKEGQYSNEPTNDMAKVDVPALAPADGQQLARNLIEGENLSSPDRDVAAEAIAREADYVAYFIHHIVRSLKMTQRTAQPATVAEAVRELLTDANDPLELSHYRDRLAIYYPADRAVVLAVLDELAAHPGRKTKQVLNAVKAQLPFDDKERLLGLLRLLERDHYLVRTPDGAYQFRFPLIRQWWRLDRGL